MHDPALARDVHIADSLAGVPYVEGRSRIADLGSGAGLPGLVLAGALPAAEVFCVESARKKADWIAATAVACGLENASAVWSRAEAWDAGLNACDAVVARALAPLNVLLEYAAPLLREGGRAVLWKGAVASDEAATGRAAAAHLGLSDPEVVAVVPFAGSERRTLWVFDWVRPAPAGFPRRPGMALKRPLGA
ncbi:MAG: rRNA (guanine527-N7)-methyltransferase [Solirubrobacteraceae bacterium]|nr:rRNA (guanine527-N7)-methyltransferase [Solirubrobacteraceae bacterium]